MGRCRFKIVALLLVATLVTGCYSAPPPIDTNLPYVDKVTGGDRVTSNGTGGNSWGGDDMADGHDPNNSSNPGIKPPPMSIENPEYVQSVESSIAVKEEDSTPTTPVEPFVPSLPDKVTYENVTNLTKDQLIAYYGNHDSRGYYKGDGSFYAEDIKCFGESLVIPYEEAVASYSDKYGTPSLAFSDSFGDYTYWFTDVYVYCVANINYNVCASISRYTNTLSPNEGETREAFQPSDNNSMSVYDDACATYGETYHTDYYHYIFNTTSGYLSINRIDYGVRVI